MQFSPRIKSCARNCEKLGSTAIDKYASRAFTLDYATLLIQRIYEPSLGGHPAELKKFRIYFRNFPDHRR